MQRARMWVGVVVCVVMAWVVPNAVAAPVYEGQWTGDGGAELSLVWDEDVYDGTFKWAGREWWVELHADGQGIIYPGDGTEKEIALQRQGENVIVRIGSETLTLRRPGAAASPAKENEGEAARADANSDRADEKPGATADAAKEGAKGADADDAPADASAAGEWKVYRHPSGAFLEHPADWKLQQLDAGIALLPPDFNRNDELILVIGEPAAGVNGVRDPQVAQYFDQLVGTLAPGLRRSGEVERKDTRGGEGAVYEYTGKLQDGRPAKARLHAAIVGPNAVAVALVATDAAMSKRAPTVGRIFSSVGMAQAQRDAALVGAWRRSTQESDISNTGSYFFRENYVYTLAPDGGMQMQRSTRMNTEGNLGAGGHAKGESQHAGTWSAENGRLFIVWEDGTTTSAAYEVGADGLVVKPDGGKALRLHRAQ